MQNVNVSAAPEAVFTATFPGIYALNAEWHSGSMVRFSRENFPNQSFTVGAGSESYGMLLYLAQGESVLAWAPDEAYGQGNGDASLALVSLGDEL